MCSAISYTVGFRQSKTALFDWPSLIQSVSASRKRPFSTRLFCDWILLVLLLKVSRVHFVVFVLLPDRCGWCQGILLYGTRKSVGISVRRAFFASNACFTSVEPSSSGLVVLGLAESRQGYVRGVALSREPPKLPAGVAVVGKMASITRATTAVV